MATKLPDFGPFLQSKQTRSFSDSLPDLKELYDTNFRVDKFAILPLPPTWDAIRKDNTWSPDTFTGRAYRLTNEAIVTLVKKDIIITASHTKKTIIVDRDTIFAGLRFHPKDYRHIIQPGDRIEYARIEAINATQYKATHIRFILGGHNLQILPGYFHRLNMTNPDRQVEWLDVTLPLTKFPGTWFGGRINKDIHVIDGQAIYTRVDVYNPDEYCVQAYTAFKPVLKRRRIILKVLTEKHPYGHLDNFVGIDQLTGHHVLISKACQKESPLAGLDPYLHGKTYHNRIIIADIAPMPSWDNRPYPEWKTLTVRRTLFERTIRDDRRIEVPKSAWDNEYIIRQGIRQIWFSKDPTSKLVITLKRITEPNGLYHTLCKRRKELLIRPLIHDPMIAAIRRFQQAPPATMRTINRLRAAPFGLPVFQNPLLDWPVGGARDLEARAAFLAAQQLPVHIPDVDSEEEN